MLILKHSYLDRNKQLVKVLDSGKYGIMNIILDKVQVEPFYDLLQYDNYSDTIWAKQDDYYFIIDSIGQRLNSTVISESDWMYIDKNDRCPSCNGGGCSPCFGFGVVPIGGDYSEYFAD